VAEERAQRLGHGEHELSMRQAEEDLVGEMLGKEDRPLPAAGRAEIEPLAGERTKVIVSTLGVRATDTRDALKIVAAGAKPLAELLDTVKPVLAVGSGVLLIVLCAEVVKVPLEYGMELVAAAGNVLIPRSCRDRDFRVHIVLYERNQLFASDRELVYRSPHNIAHPPDAFSSLRSCECAGDAVVSQTPSAREEKN